MSSPVHMKTAGRTKWRWDTTRTQRDSTYRQEIQEARRVARFNIAALHRTLGDLAAAEEQLCRVVALDKATNSPDLDNDSEELAQVQRLLRQKRGN